MGCVNEKEKKPHQTKPVTKPAINPYQVPPQGATTLPNKPSEVKPIIKPGDTITRPEQPSGALPSFSLPKVEPPVIVPPSIDISKVGSIGITAPEIKVDPPSVFSRPIEIPKPPEIKVPKIVPPSSVEPIKPKEFIDSGIKSIPLDFDKPQEYVSQGISAAQGKVVEAIDQVKESSLSHFDWATNVNTEDYSESNFRPFKLPDISVAIK